jgi:argininosuccinate lyase
MNSSLDAFTFVAMIKSSPRPGTVPGKTGKAAVSAKSKNLKSKSVGKHPAKMWDGRFEESMAKVMETLSFSLHVDGKLFREDIAGSLAHAEGLLKAKVLSGSELKKMQAGLRSVYRDLEAGKTLFESSDEDIHMAVERILTERIGALGKKLHTGRSRNDQVATDFRLYVRRQSVVLEGLVLKLQAAILEKAIEYQSVLMPGYTHVQQAQPIYIGHYLLSFYFALERDRSRLSHVRNTVAEMPLGSGALAGSAFPYPRETVAKLLGFERPSYNSIDATSHRDFALELLHAAASLGALLSSYAEDFVLWSSQEYGYVRLGDAYTTGSSMMPQKKNPDSMELIRGKSGRLLGQYTRLFTVMKGLPHAYDRDLQEDKEGVFDAVDTLKVCLKVMAEALRSARFMPDVILKKMHPSMLATDLADYLVEKGIPFRDAHHTVGSMVGKADKLGCSFLDLPEADWDLIPDGKRFRKKLTFGYSAERRNIQGGTGSRSVNHQIQTARSLLSKAQVVWSKLSSHDPIDRLLRGGA